MNKLPLAGTYVGLRQLASAINRSASTPVLASKRWASSNGSGATRAATTVQSESENALNKPSLVELAATITREAEKLEKYFKETGTPRPGFDVDSPLEFPKLPDELKKSREEVMRASKELEDLLTGPTEILRWMAWDV